MKRIVRFGIGKGLKTFNIKILFPGKMSEHNFLLSFGYSLIIWAVLMMLILTCYCLVSGPLDHNNSVRDNNSTKLDSVTSGRMRNIEQESETLL